MKAMRRNTDGEYGEGMIRDDAELVSGLDDDDEGKATTQRYQKKQKRKYKLLDTMMVKQKTEIREHYSISLFWIFLPGERNLNG